MNSDDRLSFKQPLIQHGLVIIIYYLTQFTLVSAEEVQKITDVSNYRQYSESFASSGQPSIKTLELIQQSGVKRVIYLAFTNNTTAIENEDRIVKSLGMDYVHIPVDFDNPTLADFQTFVSIMEQSNDKTLLHCQVNFRASVFSFLYRVIFKKISMQEAKKDLDSVWQLNEIWFEFLKKTLSHYKRDYQCESCDWEIHEMAH